MDQANELASLDVDGVVGYLGAINRARMEYVLAAAMGFFAVTFGSAYDGRAAVAHLESLGSPVGMSVVLDLEGLGAFHSVPATLISSINGWSELIAGAGYMPCLYVGVPQPLTSEELTKLAVVRYWKGQGRCVDRYGHLAEPESGWCMTQVYPSIMLGDVKVDDNLVGQDYHGRVPAWIEA